jgi:hypothetical protein
VIPKPLSRGSHTNFPYDGVLFTSTLSGFIIDRQFMNIMSLEVIIFLQIHLDYEIPFARDVKDQNEI